MLTSSIIIHHPGQKGPNEDDEALLLYGIIRAVRAGALRVKAWFEVQVSRDRGIKGS